MSAFDFVEAYSTGAIIAHATLPHYRVRVAQVKNTVTSETIGGIVRSQVRGADRLRLGLDWPNVSGDRLADYLAWHARCGGSLALFRVELHANLTTSTAGTLLPVRSPAVELEYHSEGPDLYSIHVDLLEDLG